jgi:hypothetical protein
MRATTVDAEGRPVRDCTDEAVWSTSDSSIARPGSVNIALGRQLVKSQEGDVTLTAVCGADAGTMLVRIGHFTLSGIVRSTTGEVIAEAAIGPAARSSATGDYQLDLASEDGSLRISKPGFETVVTRFQWNLQPAMRQDIVLSPLSGILRQGEGRLCQVESNAGCEGGSTVQDVVSFSVPRAGDLRLATYFQSSGGSGVDEGLIVGLRCNGVTLPGFDREVQNGTGDGFTIVASPACQYELTFRNGTRRNPLPYQWTLSLQ